MMEKSSYYDALEPQVRRYRDLINSPDTDPEDKGFAERIAIASIDRSLDDGEITREQREKLINLLGVIQPVL